MNGYAEYNKLSLKPDRIIALDYYTGVAKPGSDRETDWKRGMDGCPQYARHSKHLNVLFSDQSVRSLHFSEVDWFRNNTLISRNWDAP